MTNFWLQGSADELIALVRRQVPGSIRAQAWELVTKHLNQEFMSAMHVKESRQAKTPARQTEVSHMTDPIPAPPTPSVDVLEAIKAREQAATKGPWAAKNGGIEKVAGGRHRCDGIAPAYHNHPIEQGCYDGPETCPATCEIVTTDSGYYGPDWADAEFIAHARQDIPALIAEVERLRGRDRRDAPARHRMAELLVPHVGCGSLDDFGSCDMCREIRSRLWAFDDLMAERDALRAQVSPEPPTPQESRSK